MLQDSKGFIWLGTQNGLNRYDGYSFTHYFATPFDSNGLQSNSIIALCEDSSGVIWIGTQDKGLNALDRKTGKITHYQYEISNATTISSNRIFCLFIDSKKRLWIGTGSGLDYFDPRTKSFLRYEFNKKVIFVLNSDQISSITEDKNGNLLIESMVGILSFNPLKGSADIQFQTDHSDMWIRNIFRTGNEWLAYIRVSLGRYAIGNINFENKKFIERYCDFQPTTINSVLKKDDSSFFIGSAGGLYIFHTRSNTLEQLEISSGQPSNSSTDNIRSMIIDFNDNLWVGTFDGIYILEKSTAFSHNHLLVNPLRNKNSISQTIRSLYYNNKHELLAGTKSGLLFQWDSLRNGFILSRAVGNSKKSAQGSAINSMVEDLHGRLWIAKTNGPCYVLENSIVKKKFSSHEGDSDVALGENGHTVFRDRAGMIWLGVNDRNLPSKANIFLKYDPAINSAKTYRYFTLKDSLTEEHGVFSFLEDKDGGFWLATANGLFLFDRVNETFTPYKYDYRDTKSISSNNVWVLHEDRAGNFWVGTWGGGLNLFDRAAKKFKHFTEKDGLPSNIVFSILEAGDSTLWIGTGNGISHFDPKTKVFTNYDKSDGLLDDEFQPNVAAMTQSGEIFFGGTNRVSSFFPDKMTGRNSYSPLAITSFSVFGKRQYGDLSNGDQIKLSYNENDFSFDFATLDFKGNAKKRYAYKLEGLDEDWIQSGSRNFVAYNNIAPGSYIIRIKAINSEGVWASKEIAIQLVITPPLLGNVLVQGILSFTYPFSNCLRSKAPHSKKTRV